MRGLLPGHDGGAYQVARGRQVRRKLQRNDFLIGRTSICSRIIVKYLHGQIPEVKKKIQKTGACFFAIEWYTHLCAAHWAVGDS